MTSNKEIEHIVENINNHANDILANGGGDKELLLSLSDMMDEIKKVMDASTQKELNDYGQKYNAFYRYGRLLEKLASGIADGTISMPKQI
jgi:hypothetical protein